MKEKILRATAKLIAKDGLNAASTRAICSSLSITAPTLYHYFRDKASLLDSVSALAFEKHLGEMNAHPKPAAPVEDLRKAWDAYMDFARHSPELYLVMIDAVSRGKVPEAGRICLADLTAKFAACGKRLVHAPEVSAHIYLATAQGIATLALAHGNANALHHTVARDAILNSLIKDTDTPL